MKQLFYIVLLLFGFQLLGQNHATISNDDVVATIGTQDIKVGEQTTIDLEVTYSAAEEELIFPALQDTITKFIEIVEIGNIDTTFDEDDVTLKILSQRITITSWDSGYHVIPPFTFVVGGVTLKTNPLVLNVNDVEITEEQDIKDIKTILEVPFSLTDYLLSNKKPIGIGLLILLIIVVAIIMYRRYKNRPVVEEEVIVPKEAADLVATRKLQELSDKKLWQDGKVKAYYSDLSFIIREYIENRYLVHALELTTDETIALINSGLITDKETIKKLEEILLLADMAKFAKQQPIGSENEDAYKNALQFVSLTKYIDEPKTEEDNA
jgi:hypothetical protein